MADKNRRIKEPRHIRLYHSLTGSEAWQHLSGNAIKVLIALARYDDGKSNGHLFFSERTGAKDTGLSRNTVRRSLDELIEKGFIAQTKPGAFNRNNLQAATYRLTWIAWPGGRPSAPTRDFEKWKHDGNSQAQILTETGSNFEPPMETPPESGSNFEPPWLENRVVSVNAPISKFEPQVVYHRDRAEALETAQRKQAISTPGAFLASLRDRLAEHLRQSAAGEQTRLAAALGIPGGTMSKFIAGRRGLPDKHAAALSEALPPVQLDGRRIPSNSLQARNALSALEGKTAPRKSAARSVVVTIPAKNQNDVSNAPTRPVTGQPRNGVPAPAVQEWVLTPHLPDNFTKLPPGAMVSRFEDAFNAIGRDPQRLESRERMHFAQWLNNVAELHNGEDDDIAGQARRLWQEVAMF